MAQNSDFSKEVRIALIKKEWTFTDLAKKVSNATGLFCDQSYISRILSGERTPPKIVAAINEILELEGSKND